MQIIGNDVIGLPGQNLTEKELHALVGIADGLTPTEIATAIDTDTMQLRHIETNLRHKLGAKTKTHTVSRGFVTGVLITRALCFLLAFSMALDMGDDFTRARRARSQSTRSVQSRARTRTRNSGLC
jgi:DNA-binding CsgD family transcriptional regulator